MTNSYPHSPFPRYDMYIYNKGNPGIYTVILPPSKYTLHVLESPFSTREISCGFQKAPPFSGDVCSLCLICEVPLRPAYGLLSLELGWHDGVVDHVWAVDRIDWGHPVLCVLVPFCPIFCKLYSNFMNNVPIVQAQWKVLVQHICRFQRTPSRVRSPGITSHPTNGRGLG